jgi:raffinose/stachyose/melibiose transport system substrate-binding protein
MAATRRHRLLAFSLAAVFALLVAVTAAAAGGASAKKNAPAKIDYLSVTQNTVWAELLGPMTKTYAKIAPGSTFSDTKIPQEQLNQKIQLLASQNALPFLYNTPAVDATAQMQKAGQVLDVGAEFKKLGVSNELVPAATVILKKIYGPKLAALPLEFNIEGVWYNKKIFAQHGISVPKTYDQLVADAAKLEAAGVQPFAASGIQGWPLTRLIGNLIFGQLGVNAMEKIKNGTAKLTDPQYVAAAAKVAELGSKGYFGQGVASLDYGPAEDLFLQGKAAMFYMGSWVLADLNDTSKDQIGLSSIGFFPFPKVVGGKGPSTLIPMNAGQPTSINPKKLTPANAQWLKYMAQHYGDIAMKNKGQVTGFRIHHMPKNVSPATKMVITQLAKAKNPVLWFEALFSAKATTISQQDAAPLVTGQMSPQQFMAAVQAAIDTAS